MNHPYLIPGAGPGPSPYQAGPGRSRPTPGMKAIMILWALAVVGLLIWKLEFSQARPVETVKTTSIPTIALSADDLLNHVNDVAVTLDKTTPKLHRAQDQITRTLPTMDRNY